MNSKYVKYWFFAMAGIALFPTIVGPVRSLVEMKVPKEEPVIFGPIYREGSQCYLLPEEINTAISAAFAVYAKVGFRLEVTSCKDDAPGRLTNSLHKKGLAVDLGVKGMGRDEVWVVRDFLQLVLGPDYDVVVEPDHIHVEFDRGK